MLPRLPSHRETLFPPEAPGYRELAQIGRGGMAEVILADRLASETAGSGNGARLVVLKRIWPRMISTPGFLSMFRHEARVGLALNHPNIVQTYELLEQPQGPAIAMEYVDGQTLGRVLNRLVGPQALTLSLRIQIVAHVLNALEHAHDLVDKQRGPLGIVHRDVSPHNVLITYDGAIKLIDFGIAQSIDSDTAQLSARATAGKIAYMAPEQIRGVRVDRRADLFSVGVMLWEMVAGRRLWRGMTDELIIRHLTRGLAVPALPAEKSVPDDLRQIISRALAVSAKSRYGSAAEMANDLTQAIRGSGEPQRRHLGHLISLAFANERAARQVLIAGHRGERKIKNSSTAEGASQPLPDAGHLRSPRPTPSGLWSRTASLTWIGSRWAGRRWLNVGLGAAVATCLIAATLSVRVVLARRSHHVGSTTPSFQPVTPTPAQAGGNPIIIAPLRARPIIPWPLPWRGVDQQPAELAQGDSALATPGRKDRVRKRRRARVADAGRASGLASERNGEPDVSSRAAAPQGRDSDEDNILAPSIDVSPPEKTGHRSAVENTPVARHHPRAPR